jgi:hypothetical protein
MCSHKNHVDLGFETAGRIGSAWTSHQLHHAHMVPRARSQSRTRKAWTIRKAHCHPHGFCGNTFSIVLQMQPGNRSSYPGTHIPACYKCSREINPVIKCSREINPVILPDFPAAFVARWKMCSHKNHVDLGFETEGRIGSAWTSHQLHHAHMVPRARSQIHTRKAWTIRKAQKAHCHPHGFCGNTFSIVLQMQPGNLAG